MSVYTSGSDESKTNKRKPKVAGRKSGTTLDKTPPAKRSQTQVGKVSMPSTASGSDAKKTRMSDMSDVVRMNEETSFVDQED